MRRKKINKQKKITCVNIAFFRYIGNHLPINLQRYVVILIYSSLLISMLLLPLSPNHQNLLDRANNHTNKIFHGLCDACLAAGIMLRLSFNITKSKQEVPTYQVSPEKLGEMLVN